MKIGKPTHYRPNDKNIAACGVFQPEYFAYDARDSNCYNCKRTHKYKIYMGQPTNRSKPNDQ